MTSEKSVATEQRLNALVPRIGALEAAPGVAVDGPHDTSSMANGWGKGTGYFKYTKLTIGGANFLLLGADGLTVGTTTDTTQIVTTALASTYQPATQKQFPVFTDNIKVGTNTYVMASMTLNADGTIHCVGFNANATTARFHVLLSLDY